MMNQEHGLFWKHSAGCMQRMLAVALLLFLAACGRHQDIPAPPKAPPRPVTSIGASSTADYLVPAPALPQRGEM
jgi:predicted small lipoprotein YifL